MVWFWVLLPTLAVSAPPDQSAGSSSAHPVALVSVELPAHLRAAGPGSWPLDAEVWADEPGFADALPARDDDPVQVRAEADPPSAGADVPGPPPGEALSAEVSAPELRARTEAGVWVGVGSGLVASGALLLLVPDALKRGAGCSLEVRCFQPSEVPASVARFGSGAVAFGIAAGASRPRPADGSAQHRAWLQWGLNPG